MAWLALGLVSLNGLSHDFCSSQCEHNEKIGESASGTKNSGEKAAAWCKKAWCYVDPCECQLEVPPKTSSYLPKGRGNGKPIYFSYAACGAEDEYTTGNVPEACVNQEAESNCTKFPGFSRTNWCCRKGEIQRWHEFSFSYGMFRLMPPPQCFFCARR